MKRDKLCFCSRTRGDSADTVEFSHWKLTQQSEQALICLHNHIEIEKYTAQKRDTVYFGQIPNLDNWENKTVENAIEHLYPTAYR